MALAKFRFIALNENHRELLKLTGSFAAPLLRMDRSDVTDEPKDVCTGNATPVTQSGQ
jgi:hypothetical protein